MPWKGEKDPYRIWISEIILQQTRVEQGLLYYERFISRFPDVRSLAEADDMEVFKYWEGLGYYSRCRNLLFSARFIQQELNGCFPHSYEGIAALKGVGPYTSAAIASFAFGLPHAVVDGNVIRVLSRFFAFDIPVDLPASKKLFFEKANALLDRKYPAAFNQAIMDFGATVCKPSSPLCSECPLQKECKAFALGLTDKLPYKSKKPEKKKRFLHYLILEYKGTFFLRKRVEKDIWQNLYEFYLLEEDKLMNADEILQRPEIIALVKGQRHQLIESSPPRKQILSHQLLEGRFFHIRLSGKPDLTGEWLSVGGSSMKNYPFPRFIQAYIKENPFIS